MRTLCGLQRTVCACQQCVQPCRHMPGYLLPEDLEPITVALGMTNPLEMARYYLLASPGPLVVNQQTGQRQRIPMLVPDRKDDGSCIVLQDNRLCRIHAVSPAGCAFFDMHMSSAEGQRRSLLFLREIARAHVEQDAYSAVWWILWRTGRTAPPPEMTRHQFDPHAGPFPTTPQGPVLLIYER